MTRVSVWVVLLSALVWVSACHHEATHQHSSAAPPSDSEVAHWTCSMHPAVRQSGPGSCPICSMDLHPVLKKELETGELVISADRHAELGLAFTVVEPRAFGERLRALGKVVYDESSLADVTSRIAGYVEGLTVKTTGERVEAGSPLVNLFSPDLIAAQEELLAAIASQRAARSTAAPDRADYLVAAARKRLMVWGMTAEAIDAVQKTGRPMERFAVVAPISGVVLERMVVEGGAVEPGMRLFRLVGVDRVWIEAEIQPSDLARVQVGQKATIELPSRPGQTLSTRVSLLYPALDAAARTARVRMELPRGNHELRPEMFVSVELDLEAGTHLAVPAEAVLYTGLSRVVFVDLGEGRLAPREVVVGREEGGFLEVVSGLAAGDRVVSAGTFLVAAESRLKGGLGVPN